MVSLRAVVLALCFVSNVVPCVAQNSGQNSGQSPPQTPAPPAQARKTSEPYTGDLSVFESPGRDERLHIGRVMNILGVAPGKAVADIGAGSGWFTVRAAKQVGKDGLVYAIDINPTRSVISASAPAKNN